MKKYSFLILIFSVFILKAQTIKQSTVDVTGEGIVNVEPNEVTISVRVENNGIDYLNTKQENDLVVNDVLSFVKSMKLKDKDVSTRYIRLAKNYDYNTKSYTYTANNSITIKLRDLSKYEQLITGLLSKGINRIDGILFSSSEFDQYESKARELAVSNARSKAKEYAGVLGQSIGKAISISEHSSSGIPAPIYKSRAFAADAANGQQTIAPGEIEIQVFVNVSFELN